jgi:hypothetical protein
VPRHAFTIHADDDAPPGRDKSATAKSRARGRRLASNSRAAAVNLAAGSTVSSPFGQPDELRGRL